MDHLDEGQENMNQQVKAQLKINKSHWRNIRTTKSTSLSIFSTHMAHFNIHLKCYKMEPTMQWSQHHWCLVNLVNNLLTSRLWQKRDQTSSFPLKLKTAVMFKVFSKIIWIEFFPLWVLIFFLMSSWYIKSLKYYRARDMAEQ